VDQALGPAGAGPEQDASRPEDVPERAQDERDDD
jgi:hypothetical protein